jgi:tripartite-type tricarboxylate transporter receptor subunit TctC
MPHIKAGKAKALLLTSAADNAALPTASGLKALGIPQEETVLWRAIIAPKGLPPAIIKTLEEAFRQGASQQRFKDFLRDQGEEAVIASSADVSRLIKAEYTALGEVAKEIGLKK